VDRVLISDLAVRCIIGVNDVERREKQDVLINLTAFTDMRAAARSDRIEDAVDYRELRTRVVEMVEGSQYYLLEALAQAVADVCLDPADNVRKALRLLAKDMRVVAVSTVYETEPERRPDQPRYYNCVVEIETEEEPPELKRALRRIEERLGRVRTADKYASRTIDLDLLIYDDLTTETEALTLPDPDISNRPYLAAALAELAPALALPGTGLTMAALAERLPGPGMRALDEYTATLRREVAHGSQD
jgi:2-amino-4-hydroxy-6-hydroxymethyldihydropteridine diphosphokinase